VVFGAAMMMSGALVHTSALLTDRGFSPDRAAAVMSMMGAANLMFRLLTGWLLDRYPAPRGRRAAHRRRARRLLMATADSFGALLSGFRSAEVPAAMRHQPKSYIAYFGFVR
jgi:MFS family permease